MILEIISGIFAVTAGLLTALIWIFVLIKKISDKFIENKFERIFHIIAEFIMAIFAIIGGIALILELTWGLYMFLFAIGLILYAIINAIGIYSKKEYKLISVILIGSAIITITLAIIDFVVLVF